MAWFLYALSWIGLTLQCIFAILSLASGLYYLCELVEEYSVVASKVLKYMIWITTVVFLCLWLFDSFPIMMCLMGLIANGVHLTLLNDFPSISVMSAPFILTVVAAIINHVLAFRYFASIWYPFTEVLAYFTICLWLVPFGFFISLTANDLVLPTVADARENRGKRRQGTLRTMMDLLREYIIPSSSNKRF